MKKEALRKIEERIKNIEDLISQKGVGANYVKKAQRVQRDVNIGLMIGTLAVGVAAWMFLSSEDE